MTRARIRSWICLAFYCYLQQAELALLTSIWPCINQPHLSTGPGFHLGQNRVFLNCGSLSLLTKYKTILEDFRSRIISVPQVMFLLLACPSKMKEANIKAFGAAFY